MRAVTTICICLFSLTQIWSQDAFLKDFAKRWKNATDYTLEFAEAMPRQLYDYRPTESQMPFHRQLTHMAGNMIWLTTTYLGGSGFDHDLDDLPTSKDKVTEHLRQAFGYAAQTLAAFDETELDERVPFVSGQLSKRQIMFLLNDHLTHHRGQLVVYLRLNDIKPPPYVGW